MQGITKIKDGYWVRVGWLNKKPIFQKTFCFNKYSSQKQALKAAKDYRDKKIKELTSKGLYPPKRSKNKPSKRSSSGVCGVSRTNQRSGGEKIEGLHVWQAAWTNDDGTKGYASFAEEKYGADTAFEMACASRKIKKNFRKLTAKEFDQLFDDGESIMLALDTSRGWNMNLVKAARQSVGITQAEAGVWLAEKLGKDKPIPAQRVRTRGGT